MAPQACAITGTIGTAPAGGSTGVFPTVRLNRNGTPSECSVPAKAYPGTLAGTNRPFNVHNFANTSSTPSCVTFTLTNTNGVSDVLLSVHRSPFVAGDISTAARYLGDAGSSAVSTGVIKTFQTVIPANTSIAVVVTTADSSTSGTTYNLDVSSNDSTTGNVCGLGGSGTRSYTGAVVPIPDATAAGVDVTLPVTGIGRIRDMNFRFLTGGTCNATVGNTNAAIDHTFIGDLTFKLTSPKGTTATFQARRGGTRENICDSTLTDEFNNPLLSSLTSITGSTMSGSFQPELTGRLSLFRGENADGLWTLNVSDNSGADTGSLRRFGLSFTNLLYPNNDFDNDGKSDIAIYRPSVGEWYFRGSISGSVGGATFGISTDKIVPGDYTGDGQTDLAFFRPSTGNWFVLRSEDSSFYSFPFGVSTDIPAPADYDGDGKTDAAVFRPSNGTWYIINSSDLSVTINTFGTNGDIPLPGLYDRDSKADLTIFRPSVGEWYTFKSQTSTVSGATFGSSSDKPVPGDYTGDGKVDYAFYRPGTGNWFVLRSEDSSFFAAPFGVATDIPARGDYDGDGKNDFAVYRPSNQAWYISNSSNAVVQIYTFGVATDRVVAAYYLP